MIQQYSSPGGDAFEHGEEALEPPREVPSPQPERDIAPAGDAPHLQAVPVDAEGSVQIPRTVLQETLQRFAKSGESLREDMYLRSKLSQYENSPEVGRPATPADQDSEDASARR
jgi:hypothetical protein